MTVLQEYLWSKGWSTTSVLLRQGSGSGVKDMLDSSTNLIAQLASWIGEDQDEEVATNKYLQWSLGRRHRRGARRRRVGHRKKRG
jgi:hypothetical protein